MGVGGALIVSLAFAILPTLFSEQRRPRAVSVLAATVFVGVPLGPLVAGWLLDRYTWGSIFLINVPVVLVALVGVWLLVPESRDEGAARIDWAGAGFSMAGVAALVYGIIEQPILGWDAPRVIAALLVGVLLCPSSSSGSCGLRHRSSPWDCSGTGGSAGPRWRSPSRGSGSEG